MTIEKICAAYSSKNDDLLCKELRQFQKLLKYQVQMFGPAITMLQLGDRRVLEDILNKTSVLEGEGTVGERLAWISGSIAAILGYFQAIAERQKVDETDALLSCSDNKALEIRMTLLKATLTSIGTRATELVNVVAEITKVSTSFVKFHIKKLVEMNLLERTELGRKAVYYRLTGLGEAVLTRRCHPYEVALFCINLAASDAEMRAAIRDEIRRTWPADG